MAAMGADELFTLKNSFWLGNFQEAINEGAVLTHATGETATARDVWVYRSYVGLENYAVVLDEVPESATGPLGCVRTLASYLSNREENTVKAVEAARSWATDPTLSTDDTACVIAANIFNHEHDYDNALRVVRNSKSLPQLAMTVQVLLRMDRADLAAAKYGLMAKLDDDSSITLLTGASVALAQGGDSVADAVQTYKELIERFGSSKSLLNGLGAAFMVMGKFDEAEKQFVKALGMGATVDTLVNVIACAHHLAKPKEYVDRFISTLRRLSPKHPAVASLDSVERVFDRVAGTTHK